MRRSESELTARQLTQDISAGGVIQAGAERNNLAGIADGANDRGIAGEMILVVSTGVAGKGELNERGGFVWSAGTDNTISTAFVACLVGGDYDQMIVSVKQRHISHLE